MLFLLHPAVSKYCEKCFKLNDDTVYLSGGSGAWWTQCPKCRIIK